MANCSIERRKVVRHGTLNMLTGEYNPGDTETVEIAACGTPLFGDGERALGVCRGCLKGWSVPGNAPTRAGLAQIEAAKAKGQKNG